MPLIFLYNVYFFVSSWFELVFFIKVGLTRLLYIGYLVRDEAFQVPRLVLILFRTFGKSFSSVSNFKPIICCQFTALQFMRFYS